VSLVLDASVALSWCFADEAAEISAAALDAVAERGAVVPPLWRIEVANALTSALRRKRIDAAFRAASLADLAALPVAIDAEGDSHVWSTTLRLADQHRLTVYDAIYLELAQRRRLPLATLDEALRAAARASGVELFGAAS
jgi:predicted nucleic acid-binding protein